MPCGSCIDKLAYKLMRHHKIDMIRAYELAEKGIERYESRDIIPDVKSGNPTDYVIPCDIGTCTSSDAGCTKKNAYCTLNSQCVGGSCTVTGSCSCPSPLAHSHQISPCSGSCTFTGTCAYCYIPDNACTPSCRPRCLGTCGYDCDVGYVWNPVTLQCELIVVGEARGDGYYFLDTG